MNNGKEVASFSLATTESWKAKDTGEWQKKTEWHRIVVFSEGLVRYIKGNITKGMQLYIEGTLYPLLISGTTTRRRRAAGGYWVRAR